MRFSQEVDSNSGTITRGTIATGSTSLSVLSASTFEVGQNIYVYTHAAKGNNLSVDGGTNTDVYQTGIPPHNLTWLGRSILSTALVAGGMAFTVLNQFRVASGD